MKADELKELVKKMDDKQKNKLIALLYNKVPKSKKEDVDENVMAILENKPAVKKVKVTSFEDIKNEAYEFIDLAESGEYYRGRKVSKKDKSNWRYKAANIAKALFEIKKDSPYFDEATGLLINMYMILGYGATYGTFVTFNTFSAIKISNEQFLYNIINRLFAKEITDNVILKAMDLVLYPYTDSNTLKFEIAFCLYDNLMHINYDEEEIDSIFIDKIVNSKHNENKRYSYDEQMDSYAKRTAYNALVLAYLYYLLANNNLSDSSIDFIFDSYDESDNEIKLYVLFSYALDGYQKEYIHLYDYLVKKYKIKPRDSLKERYLKEKEKLHE